MFSGHDIMTEVPIHLRYPPFPKSFPPSFGFAMAESVDLVGPTTKAITSQGSLFSEILW